jgi:hypothetical protein
MLLSCNPYVTHTPEKLTAKKTRAESRGPERELPPAAGWEEQPRQWAGVGPPELTGVGFDLPRVR